MHLNMLTTLERCAWQELCNSWYFENVMPLRVTWTKHTVLLAIGTKNTFQTTCAFLALLFATIFASIPLDSFHMRSGSMNSASFACLPRIRRKNGNDGLLQEFWYLRENKYSFFGLQLWLYIFETTFLLLIVLACFVQLIDNESFREVYAFQFQLFQLIFSVLIFFLYYIYIIYIYLIIN